jgi:hypothetical protein
MCKSEIFAETINLVAQETEIPASRILSSDRNLPFQSSFFKKFCC